MLNAKSFTVPGLRLYASIMRGENRSEKSRKTKQNETRNDDQPCRPQMRTLAKSAFRCPMSSRSQLQDARWSFTTTTCLRWGFLRRLRVLCSSSVTRFQEPSSQIQFTNTVLMTTSFQPVGLLSLLNDSYGVRLCCCRDIWQDQFNCIRRALAGM